MAACKTRASSLLYGLGPAATKDDLVLPTSKLPTLRMIIRALKYLTTETCGKRNRSVYESATVLFPQIENIYKRAGVPLQSGKSNPKDLEKSTCNKLVKFFENDKKFRKTAKNKRTVEKEKEYNDLLDKSCVLWPKDAFLQIENEEDKLFLQ